MMPAVRPHPLAAIVGAVAAAAGALFAQPPAPVARPIAIFGTSVASGTGDETGRAGHAARLRELLQPRGWAVLKRPVGARVLVGQPAPERIRACGARHLVRAVAVRRARARQADSYPRHGRRLRPALTRRGPHLLPRYDDASIRHGVPGTRDRQWTD